MTLEILEFFNKAPIKTFEMTFDINKVAEKKIKRKGKRWAYLNRKRS